MSSTEAQKRASLKWQRNNRAARKVIQARWDEKNPEALREKTRRYKRKRPEAHRAHEAVRRAVKAGLLERGPCELAGDECNGAIQAHHDDYEQRLDVRWLCKAHHTAHHYKEIEHDD